MRRIYGLILHRAYLDCWLSSVVVRTDVIDPRAHQLSAPPPNGAQFSGAGTLSEWAKRIAEWSKDRREVWVYFDNDDSGYAPKNALELKAKVAGYFSNTK